jgi:hydroxylamine reductase
LIEINREVVKSLFMTITNANFDEKAIMGKINQMIALRNNLREKVLVEGLRDAAIYEINTDRDMLFKASYVGIIPNEDKDITSLKQLITFGLSGISSVEVDIKLILGDIKKQ